MKKLAVLLTMLPLAARADIAPMMPPSIEEHPWLVLLTFVGVILVSVMTGNKVCRKLMEKMKCRYGTLFAGFRFFLFGGFMWLFLVAILIAGALGLWGVVWMTYDKWWLRRWEDHRSRQVSGGGQEAAEKSFVQQKSASDSE